MTVTANNSIIPQLNSYVTIKKSNYLVKNIETDYDAGIISIQLN
jgi:hypothetical protein